MTYEELVESRLISNRVKTELGYSNRVQVLNDERLVPIGELSNSEKRYVLNIQRIKEIDILLNEDKKYYVSGNNAELNLMHERKVLFLKSKTTITGRVLTDEELVEYRIYLVETNELLLLESYDDGQKELDETESTEFLKLCLSDRFWRLNSLYKVKNAKSEVVKFVMNEAQVKLYDSFWNKNVVLKARQLGITTFMCIFQLDEILFSSNSATMIIAHKISDAEHFFQNKVLFAYDKLPPWLLSLRPSINRNGNKLVIKHANNNTSVLRVATSGRSDTLNYLHISEFGKVCAKRPQDADEIMTGALNAGVNQITTFESTAEGAYGHFYKIATKAEEMDARKELLTKMDYKYFFFSWLDHPDYKLKASFKINDKWKEYFDKIGCADMDRMRWYIKKEYEQGNRVKQEFPSNSREAFERIVDGVFFSRELVSYPNLFKEYAHIPGLKVHTSWDLARTKDINVILCFQILDDGRVRIINCLPFQGKSLGGYIKDLRDIGIKNGYTWGLHYAPHDMKVTDYTSEYSRRDVALMDYGFRFEVFDKLPFQDGIDAIRYCIKDGMQIDSVNCDLLIAAMRVYRRAYNEKLGVFTSSHHHGPESDFCDSLRYCCLSIRLISKKGNDIIDCRDDIKRGGIL